MTREIKFRAWDTEEKTMDYSGDLYDFPSAYSFFRTQEDAEIANNIILMQFTGLCDKNGKEIYEGDVVYLAGYGDYEVEWPFIQLYQSAWENDIGEIKGNIREIR